MLDDRESDARGHHPVGERLHGHGRVGVDHHRPIRIRFAEGAELARWTTEVQGALGLQRRHEDPLLRRQDLRRLAHEPNARDDQRLRRVVTPEAGHFQGVGHAAAGLVGEVLDVAVYVVVRDQDRVPIREQPLDFAFQFLATYITQQGRCMHRYLGRLQAVVA